MCDTIPVDEDCYLISHHNCYLSASRLLNCWGGVKPDKYTRWRFCPTGEDGIYHIKSYDGRYLTRKWSGVVELHRKEQDEDETGWKVIKTYGFNGKPKFSFFIKNHYLLCMQTGWILANTKECNTWEQWTITTKCSEKPLKGPSGRRSAFYVCAGGLLAIGGVVAAVVIIAANDGKGGASKPQQRRVEPKQRPQKREAPAEKPQDCEEKAAPAASDKSEDDADNNADKDGTLIAIGKGALKVVEAVNEHGPKLAQAIGVGAEVIEAGKRSLGLGLGGSEYEEEYDERDFSPEEGSTIDEEERPAPGEGEASTYAPAGSLAEPKPSTRAVASTRAMAETGAPTEAPAPTIAKSRNQKKTQTKKIILVGKSGVGKSTLCSMLLQGDLYSENAREISNGATSATDCQVLTGQKWTVCDTPGLGEMYDGTTDTAIKPIVQVLQEERLAFHYIAYVIKQGRLSIKEHAEHFELFKSTFVGAEENFILIVTHCEDGEWIKENRDDIASVFGEKIPVTFCDFPFNAKNVEKGKQERLNHLSEFEDEVLSLENDAIVPWITRGAVPPVENTIERLSISSETTWASASTI
ncbi:hypothetical protein BGX26_005447 [Mortierella sp. AD094]|nr:hypothetical protein BGX26_005447 [Mortierella sp. AD094]